MHRRKVSECCLNIGSNIHLYLRCGRDYCSAKEIMSIADAMATNGMKQVGYEYINLDGGFNFVNTGRWVKQLLLVSTRLLGC